MKNLLLIVSLVAMLTASHANPVVLDFEDLAGARHSGADLVNYKGVTFDGNFFTFDDPEDPYNPSSGTVRAATNLLTPFGEIGESLFSFTNPVTFLGAWFAGYDFEPISFNLYLGGNLVGTSSSLLASDVPTWLASGFSGKVDSVGIQGYRGYYIVDDVTYATPDTASTLWLAMAGVAGLAFVRRHRRTV
ncbi:hypothetical protein [Nibricoccus sp. IMCC34717]|uniref:hypothetical protein n=1 Tax=Nibricoccus sp. IMCC34717 TaxID=3034021 RepID=UPI00384AA28C